MRFGKLVTPSRRRSRCKLCSNWARLVVIGLGALASAAGDTLVLPGGNIAVNSSCGTTFGSCSSASSSGNDLTFEQLNWFENKFGVLGRVSSNLTQGANFENAGASANYLTDLMIPPQQNLKAGDLVTFQLPYYIDGTVAIDWGDNFAVDADGNLIDLTKTAVDFTLASEILNLQTGQPDVQHLEDRHYSGNNHLTDVISDNVLVSGVVTIGEPFEYSLFLYLNANANFTGTPTSGFVEGDFLHTGVMGPAIVLDSSGNPISNPLVLSANGFDFANPQGAATVPEPSSIGMVLMAGLAVYILRRKCERRI